MKKELWLAVLAFSLLVPIPYTPAFALPMDIYVSPSGNDAHACSSTSPCKTIQKGISMVQPGGTVYVLAGTYSEMVTVSKMGTQTLPIRIIGQGAILSNGGSGAFIVNNSQWVTFEGFTIRGYTLLDFEIKQSHYLTFRNNILEYMLAAIRIKEGVSHLLIEGNEMYQTHPAGSTWSSLKGSPYDGAGVYASTGAQGMYYIRGNYFHDSMNAIAFTDVNAGQWMNSNIFISGNTFQNIVDDPFEPEGDSFNIHFYNNTLLNTHRMASVVPDAACLGPVFVYGNFQRNTLDPTREASSGRKNSAIKMDMSGGTCPNGVWVFNNTVTGNVAGTNFYAVDLLTSSVRNYQMLNNVLVTERNAYSRTPSFTNAVSDYNISLRPFGYVEEHGLQSDPLLNSDGTLQANSPAKERVTPINISDYFVTSEIVPSGADLGAFRSFPAPKYVLPPGGAPAGFPANISGWPDMPLPPTSTSSPVATPSAATATPTLTHTPTLLTSPTSTATPAWTFTALPPTFTSTSIPASATAGNTVVYDDSNPALSYSASWQNISRRNAFGGSYRITGQAEASVLLNFTGQSFSIIYTQGRDFGNMDVYVDNQLVTTLSQNSRQNQFQQRWDYPGTLLSGLHELKLIFKGPQSLKGSIDAVIIR